MPSCPLSPRPQQYADPSAMRAQVCAPPVATDLYVVVEGTTTVNEALPLCPSEVAVIVADPAATADTRPVADTVAIAASEVAQEIERPVNTLPLASCVVAVNWYVAPIGIVKLAGTTVTVATGAAATTVTAAVSV